MYFCPQLLDVSIPSDSSSIHDLSPSHHPNNGHLYDLQGHRLNNFPQKGIFIQNGRKYVK